MALTKIGTDGVKDDAITSGKIPANAVGSSELADNAVDTDAIQNGAVTSAKIGTNAVSSGQINDNAVGSNQITSDAVVTSKIAAGSITTNRIADQAVTLDKLPHGTSSNDGKFLRANNGADPSFESIPAGITINNNTDNRVITGGSGTTLNAESNLTFDGTGNLVQSGSAAASIMRVETTANDGDALIQAKGKDSSGNERMIQMRTDSGADQYRIISSDTSYDLALCTGNAERLTIKGNTGKVGIGTTSPVGKLTVTNGNITLSDGHGFTNGADADKTYVAGTSGSSGYLQFGVNNTEVMRVSNDGKVAMGHTSPAANLDVKTAHATNEANFLVRNNNVNYKVRTLSDQVQAGSETNHPFYAISNNQYVARFDGDGIKFGSDSAAANALNDYENGTWTVTMNKAGTTGNADSQVHTRAGIYTKVGDLLFISFYWYSQNLNFGSGNYQWYISGLPYNVMSNVGGATQFIPGGYQYNNGTVTAYNVGNYRWQSNNTNGQNTLAMYGNMQNSNASGGAWEWSGCGCLRCV